MSGSKRDSDETNTVLGIGSLFESDGVPSPPTAGSSGSSRQGGGIREADLKQLAESLSGKTLDGDDAASVVSRKTAKVVFEDDATSVATTKRQQPTGEDADWVDAAEDDAIGILRTDYLAQWPADKVMALMQHVRTAPWHDVRYRLQTFPNGMTGAEIVLWLKSANFAKNDEEAHRIGEAMVARRMFYQLNRKTKFTGFAATQKQQYTLEDSFTDDNVSLSSKLSRAVKSANEQQVAPFRLVKGNHVVHVVIEERQRRPDPSFPYSSEFLRPVDGPGMSMDKALVPCPAVDQESPDMCEFVADWEVIVSEDTDDEGWKYSIDFKEPSRFVKGDVNNKNFLTRLREWQRPARKRIEKKSERAEAGLEVDVAPEVEKTDAELEEEKKKELLSKAATSVARVPRAGTLTLHVTHGEDLMRVCDSFVSVEIGNTPAARSDVCPRSRGHKWGFSADVSIASDLEAVRIFIFQAAALGRTKCLGQADLFIEQHALESDGDCALVLKHPSADEDNTITDAAADEDLGVIHMTWVFVPSGENQTKLSSIKRCVLRVVVEKAAGLTREKKRIGPCGVPVPGKAPEKVSIFLRVRYLGEYCEMEVQSPMFKYAYEVPMNWKFSALLLPSAPVTFEYWHSDQSLPIGSAAIAYDASNMEVPVELELRKMGIEGLPASSVSGASNIGRLNLLVHWVPELDALEELVALGLDTTWSTAQKNMLSAWS